MNYCKKYAQNIEKHILTKLPEGLYDYKIKQLK